jgi:hypothetical protein
MLVYPVAQPDVMLASADDAVLGLLGGGGDGRGPGG